MKEAGEQHASERLVECRRQRASGRVMGGQRWGRLERRESMGSPRMSRACSEGRWRERPCSGRPTCWSGCTASCVCVDDRQQRHRSCCRGQQSKRTPSWRQARWRMCRQNEIQREERSARPSMPGWQPIPPPEEERIYPPGTSWAAWMRRSWEWSWRISRSTHSGG